MNKCGIVKDLFTAYVSGVGSEETTSLVEEHIKTCADCRSKLTEVQNRVAVTLREKDASSVNVFKTMKKKIFRRNVLVGSIAAVFVAIIALFVSVRVIDYKPIPYYDGLVKVQVSYADYYKNEDDISVVITNPGENSSSSIDVSSNTPVSTGKIAVLDITCTRNYYSNNATGRTIMRDGEKVNVEYICYLESTLTKMQPDKEKKEQIFRLTHADLIDNKVRTEVYYLTDAEAVSNSKMSDKEFDDYRNQGTLVWSGIVE